MFTVVRPKVAYFSMEIALDEAIPSYSGGLGVLAGDTLRAAADLRLPMIGVSLLYRQGYFEQRLDATGHQIAMPSEWKPEEHLEPLDIRVAVTIAGREVMVQPWLYRAVGVSGHEVPIYFLDTALPENSEWDRALTGQLYGGDLHYRLCQEVVLGMGGAEVLRALGYDGTVMQHHINEGHAALLTLALLERRLGARSRFHLEDADIEAVRRQCIFTTHTPVPAGHDKFFADQVRHVLGDDRVALLEAAGGMNGELNMTHLALRFSHYVNGVAMKHGQVSREMFPNYTIDAITNGVHAVTWTAEPFRALFDKHLARWRNDNAYLRQAVGIPLGEVLEAHRIAKAALVEAVQKRSGTVLDPKVFTIGFARRSTPYKRADLIFCDLDRLKALARRAGQVQIVFAGKAHPADHAGQALIRRIHEAVEALRGSLTVVYLENYDMELGRLLTAGVDLWLNNPTKPLEASGTSGMKAALNGVPSLSVLDGWWIEGHIEGVTGWSIGQEDDPTDSKVEAIELYMKLEQTILPLFYAFPYGYAEVMRSAIALNGSYFNTQRMVLQYAQNAYALDGDSSMAGLMEAAG